MVYGRCCTKFPENTLILYLQPARTDVKIGPYENMYENRLKVDGIYYLLKFTSMVYEFKEASNLNFLNLTINRHNFWL